MNGVLKGFLKTWDLRLDEISLVVKCGKIFYYSITLIIRINWTAGRPYMQKIRIIGFFFENRLHWQLKVENNFYKRVVLGYTFIYLQIKH
jgi:hypothetical protein